MKIYSLKNKEALGYWYKDGSSMAMGTMCDTKAPKRFRAWE